MSRLRSKFHRRSEAKPHWLPRPRSLSPAPFFSSFGACPCKRTSTRPPREAHNYSFCRRQKPAIVRRYRRDLSPTVLHTPESRVNHQPGRLARTYASHFAAYTILDFPAAAQNRIRFKVQSTKSQSAIRPCFLSSLLGYFMVSYSFFASTSTGTSGSASFHAARKSWYAFFAPTLSPFIANARANCSLANGNTVLVGSRPG